jgi:hypothetical protein
MLATNNKYAFLLPLTILELIEEPIKASKVLKVLVFKIVKLKKLINKID